MVNRCIYWRQFSIILIDNGGKHKVLWLFFLYFFLHKPDLLLYASCDDRDWPLCAAILPLLATVSTTWWPHHPRPLMSQGRWHHGIGTAASRGRISHKGIIWVNIWFHVFLSIRNSLSINLYNLLRGRIGIKRLLSPPIQNPYYSWPWLSEFAGAWKRLSCNTIHSLWTRVALLLDKE